MTVNKVNSRRSHNIYQFPNWESLLHRRFIVKTNVIINSGRKSHSNWYAQSLIPRKKKTNHVHFGWELLWNFFLALITEFLFETLQNCTSDRTVVDSIWNGQLTHNNIWMAIFVNLIIIWMVPNSKWWAIKIELPQHINFYSSPVWPKKWTKHTHGNIWIGLVNRSLSCKYMLLVSILSQKLFLCHIFTL